MYISVDCRQRKSPSLFNDMGKDYDDSAELKPLTSGNEALKGFPKAKRKWNIEYRQVPEQPKQRHKLNYEDLAQALHWEPLERNDTLNSDEPSN